MVITLADIEAALTVVSIVLAIVFFFNGRRFKLPLYSVRSAHLIRNMKEREGVLEIRYAGESIANLTATKVAFWNNGRETIDGHDIAQADPIIVRVGRGQKILDVEVLEAIHAANEFSVSKSNDGASATFSFNYLDNGEGAIVQILPTGSSSRDIEVCGTIKGGAKVRRRGYLAEDDPMQPGRSSISLRRFMLFLFITPLVFDALLFLNDRWTTTPPSMKVAQLQFWFVVILINALLWAFGLLIMLSLLPRGFDRFHESLWP